MTESKDTVKKIVGLRNQKKREDMTSFMYDKLPPQAPALEEAVLGAIMLSKDALTIVIDTIRSESFYVDAHQTIYKAMIRLFERTQPIDLLTVSEELKKSGELEIVGGPYYLVELTNRVASSANLEYHARIIAQKFIRRELYRVCSLIAGDTFNDTIDVFELLDKAEQGLFEITEQNLSRSYSSMSSLLGQAVKQVEEASKSGEGLTGVPTGFVDLDRMTSGWQPSDLVIVAARPGMGKTSFTLALAANASILNKPVAFFSLEMSSIQLVKRLISMETEIHGEKLKNGKLEDYEWQQLNTAIERMSDRNIFIDDTPAINIFELRAKCRRLKMQHDIQMVMIDYLQLMTGSMDNNRGGNREQEISSISRALKGLAKELNIPVIALSQLSRAVETRGGTKRPQLSDLRECIVGDTKIYIADTGEYKRVDELIGQKGFNVLALDEAYKLQEAECLDVWETGEKEVYEVVTQSGNKITASLNHPFFTALGWQQLVDLKVGDFVATPRKINYDKPSDLKDEEIILLAHMIGDGCFLKNQPVHYTSQDEASLDIVSEAAQKLWDIKPRRVKDSSPNCYHVYLPSPYHLTHGVRHPFTNLLHRVGLKQARSHEKEIPKTIFQSNKKQIALFIKHLWATDGGIYIRKTKGASKIHYASNSFELIKGLKSLLLRFNISSSIQKTQKENYRLGYNLNITSTENILRFAEQIGIHGSKASKLEELAEISRKKTFNPNSDVVSKKIWDKARILRKEKGFTERSFQKELGMQYCGSTLYKSNLSRQRLERVATILESEELSQLANSDIKFDKIKSITHIGKKMTYDLHIADHHNFVANDFIIHNSGAIEQDADMVTFIYRPEYYQIMEDEEGNSLKGKAEVIIAKHRNGALGTVDLRFTGETAKFSDWGDGFDAFPTSNDDMASPAANIITRPSRMNDDFEDVPF